MSHEIMDSDGAVFYQQKAWHGLGVVVEQAMSPREALKLANLDWTVSMGYGVKSSDNPEIVSFDFCPIVREDTNTILSIQSPKYKPIQNSQVFDLAYSLGDNIKIESALSLQGGKKIVCLVRGDTFAPENSKHDAISKYFAILSSHDGSIALSGLPTSVRIVCANTLKMAMSNKAQAIRFTHNGDIKGKQEDMRRALAQYAETGRLFEANVNLLSSKTWNTQQIQSFFVDVYNAIEEPVSLNPSTDKEYKVYLDAKTTIARWCDTFDQERKELLAPASAWQAANAVTNDLQHKVNIKGRKISWENKAYSNLVGPGQDASAKVMQIALATV